MELTLHRSVSELRQHRRAPLDDARFLPSRSDAAQEPNADVFCLPARLPAGMVCSRVEATA